MIIENILRQYIIIISTRYISKAKKSWNNTQKATKT